MVPYKLLRWQSNPPLRALLSTDICTAQWIVPSVPSVWSHFSGLDKPFIRSTMYPILSAVSFFNLGFCKCRDKFTALWSLQNCTIFQPHEVHYAHTRHLVLIIVRQLKFSNCSPNQWRAWGKVAVIAYTATRLLGSPPIAKLNTLKWLDTAMMWKIES